MNMHEVLNMWFKKKMKNVLQYRGFLPTTHPLQYFLNHNAKILSS